MVDDVLDLTDWFSEGEDSGGRGGGSKLCEEDMSLLKPERWLIEISERTGPVLEVVDLGTALAVGPESPFRLGVFGGDVCEASVSVLSSRPARRGFSGDGS